MEWASKSSGTAGTPSRTGPMVADATGRPPKTFGSRPKKAAGWTAFNGFAPSVVVTALGAPAATAIDMADPQSALEGILPGWFTPFFLLALVVGTIAINAMTSYSSGPALQSVGVRIGRSLGVVVHGLPAVALTLYALLVSDFLDTVSNVLQLTVVLLGPGMTIYATDILLRRNRYEGPALTGETPGGTYWYTAGVDWAGHRHGGIRSPCQHGAPRGPAGPSGGRTRPRPPGRHGRRRHRLRLRDAPPPRRTRPPAALTTRVRPGHRPGGRDTLDL
ncbi:cytosine permease [Streptomyces sp. NPDC056323]|uniref:cytosine permease n=1 Tax=Streptomyces sp. NPDC056323 TaxID=3345784 RepID=UPI0035DEB924